MINRTNMDGTEKPLAVTVNDFSFSFLPEDAGRADIIRQPDGSFHVIYGNRSVILRLLEANADGKKLKMEVEGEAYYVEIRDELDQMLDKLGFSAVSARQVREIKAPMPGLVLDIHVDVGQEVAEGDKILILEAMKMENSILVHTNARIKTIHISKGQAVEKGQVLVELE
jgi:biotin carboxyl carrier protein